ncbi:MAG: ABC transporter ATP-binding protein [Alphaproteobacteria bacterium]|nr:ABC transporter ATP-binding protein [Alphaproteobacteria bacterium]
MSAASVALDDLWVAYDGTPAVRAVTGRFAPGSLTAIVGPNGAGKTSLVKAMLGLQHCSRGAVRLDGATRAEIGYLPQRAEIDRNFPISVLDMVQMGHWRRTGWFGRMPAAATRQSLAAIDAVGLGPQVHAPISTLSAGQLQRALFARVIVRDAGLIVLDEPFDAIDARTTAELMALVETWHRDGRTVIAVVHDLQQARTRFGDALLLARDVIAWGAAERVLTPDNLSKARLRLEAANESWADAGAEAGP